MHLSALLEDGYIDVRQSDGKVYTQGSCGLSRAVIDAPQLAMS
jgi:hypothetical protein